MCITTGSENDHVLLLQNDDDDDDDDDRMTDMDAHDRTVVYATCELLE